MPAIDHHKLNTVEAHQLARLFGQQADGDTQALIGTMNDGVSRMQLMISTLNAGVKKMDWAGRRATKFDNQWEGEFRPAMQRMEQHIQDFIPVLTRMQAELKDAETDLHNHATQIEQVEAGGRA